MDHVQRERKVDLNSMNQEDAKRIFNEVMAKIAELVTTTRDQANDLLKIYGLEASFTFTLSELNKKAQPKKGRSKKAL